MFKVWDHCLWFVWSERLGLYLESGELTVGGALFFAKELSRHLPQAGIDMNLFDGALAGISYYRNPLIGHMLKDYQLAEKAGRGLQKIMKFYGRNNLKRPIFDATDAYFKVILYKTKTPISQGRPQSQYPICVYLRNLRPNTESLIQLHLFWSDPRPQRRANKMETAKLFQNGSSQAVRLPKSFRIPGNEVKIFKNGNQVILEPIETTRDSLFDSLSEFPEDFMKDGRNQPPMQKRESF